MGKALSIANTALIVVMGVVLVVLLIQLSDVRSQLEALRASDAGSGKRLSAVESAVETAAASTQLDALRAADAEAARRLTGLERQYGAHAKRAEEIEAKLSGFQEKVVALRADVSQMDFSGNWKLTYKQTEFTVSLTRVDPDRYRLTPRGVVYTGVYEVKDNDLVKIESESQAYTGFIWKVKNEDSLELINSQYRGATMTR